MDHGVASDVWPSLATNFLRKDAVSRGKKMAIWFIFAAISFSVSGAPVSPSSGCRTLDEHALAQGASPTVGDGSCVG